MNININWFLIINIYTSSYEKIKYNGIPGITICIFNSFIMNGLAERYPELKNNVR